MGCSYFFRFTHTHTKYGDTPCPSHTHTHPLFHCGSSLVMQAFPQVSSVLREDRGGRLCVQVIRYKKMPVPLQLGCQTDDNLWLQL